MFLDNDFSDADIYNREYSYYYKAISMALGKAEYDTDSVVVFSGFENILAAYGYLYVMFWNKDKERLEAGLAENSIAFNIGNFLDKIQKYNKIIYLIPSYQPEDSSILENIKANETFEVKYRPQSLMSYVDSMYIYIEKVTKLFQEDCFACVRGTARCSYVSNPIKEKST